MRKAFFNVRFLWKIYGLDFGTMEGLLECVSYIWLFFSVIIKKKNIWLFLYLFGSDDCGPFVMEVGSTQKSPSLDFNLWFGVYLIHDDFYLWSWIRWHDDVELLVIWRLTHPIGALEILVMYGNLKHKSYKILKN